MRIENFSKKNRKIDFFESAKNGFQGSQSVSGTVLGAVGDPWKPFLALSKKSIFEIFFRFFSILKIFLVFHNGLLIFDSGLAEHHGVPAGYPTIHFLESRASGEQIPALVGPPRASFRPLSARFSKRPEHPLRCHFGGQRHPVWATFEKSTGAN